MCERWRAMKSEEMQTTNKLENEVVFSAAVQAHLSIIIAMCAGGSSYGQNYDTFDKLYSHCEHRQFLNALWYSASGHLGRYFTRRLCRDEHDDEVMHYTCLCSLYCTDCIYLQLVTLVRQNPSQFYAKPNKVNVHHIFPLFKHLHSKIY